MDFQFPQQLFPSPYRCGPPDSVLKQFAGDWGSYQGLRLQKRSDSSWTFVPKHEVRGETWRPAEPVPLPLLSPRRAFVPFVTPPDPLSFTQHVQNFFLDHSLDAFGCMSDILKDNFYFPGQRRARDGGAVNLWRVRNHLTLQSVLRCPETYRSTAMSRYCRLLGDGVAAVPPDVLGPLLHEELGLQRERLLFHQAATGGALAFLPFSDDGGCLLYPGSRGHDLLNFHQVALQRSGGGGNRPGLDAAGNQPFSFQLRGAVRQLSAAAVLHYRLLGVRLDHLCGVWRVEETEEPRLLQAVETEQPATCISLSPHVSGEVLLATEGGAAKLWTLERGLRDVRTQDSNLYFDARSGWRWCEFSAHPRVALYADRTGAELCDIRVEPASSHTLFRVSSASDCRSGERLVLCRYLRDAHCFHHLLATQHSAFVMDERFPGVPMLRLDHQMKSPPLFCHVVPGGTRNSKVLLGSQTQEVTMLQYRGGRSEACSSQGPPQALLRASDSLDRLPVLLPHRRHAAQRRLSAPATGLTAIGTPGGGGVFVLQLTEAGDIFYQLLESEPGAVGGAEPGGVGGAEHGAVGGAEAAVMAEDSCSDEDGVIGPTQTSQTVVAETQRLQDCGSPSEDSEPEGRRSALKRWTGPVLVNQDPDPDQDPDLDPDPKPDLDPAQGSAAVTKNGNTRSEGVWVPRDGPRPALGGAALAVWRRWLQKLTGSGGGEKPRPLTSQHFTVSTDGLLDAAAPGPGAAPGQKEHLRSCMSRRSLVRGPAPPLVPVPDPVDPAAWSDPLSRRLTASWRGAEAWAAWWEEELGAHRDARAQALRKRRRKEKEARRAAGLQAELSASFSSSASCQSDLDHFSLRSGPSREHWSDGEGAGPAEGQGYWSALLGLDDPDSGPVTSSPAEPQTRTKTERARPAPQDQLAQETYDGPAPCPALPSSSQLSSQNSLGRPSQLSQSSQSRRKRSRMGF